MRHCGPIFFACILTAASLTACTQVAWKSGAGTDDLKRDTAACREKFSDDDGIKQCLHDKGWTISDFSSPANADAETDTAPAAPTSTASTSAATARTSMPASKPETKIAADPNAKISVQTWWKAGAQAADFNSDASACLQTLGPGDTPDYALHRYSLPLIKCLRQRGWYAGRDPVYKPLR